jgi:hypothetical protein
MDYFSFTQEIHLHLFFLVISYSSLQINDLDANTQGIPLSSWHPFLNPTHELKALHKKNIPLYKLKENINP